MAIVFVRVIILYILIIVAMRVMGKRQLGELEPSELVIAMIISDLASVPMQNMGIPLLNGIMPIIILVALSFLISLLSVSNIRFRTVINGSSSVIIENGQIVQKEMGKNRFTVDELLEELRLQGVVDISTVKYAILESTGRMSVIPYPGEAPPTAAMMGVAAEGSDLQTILINGGRILDKNLKQMGRDRNWLNTQLKANNIKDTQQVYLMTVDTTGKVFFSLRDKYSPTKNSQLKKGQSKKQGKQG